MKTELAIALSLLATAAIAAPVSTTARDAIKIGCAAIQNHLPGDAGDCSDFVVVLRGDVWTMSQETGEVLNVYLTD
jgi:hypothetical protein